MRLASASQCYLQLHSDTEFTEDEDKWPYSPTTWWCCRSDIVICAVDLGNYSH